MRAISTVLDVSLCLLLVTASALTLVGTPLASEQGPGLDSNSDTADETAEALTTTTAQVTYAVGDRNRTAHGTLAGLLAAATLADGESGSTTAFRRAVTERVRRALRRFEVVFRRSDVSMQVVADSMLNSDSMPEFDSTPDPDSTPDGRIVAGPTPPPDADVHAARIEVRQVRLTVRTWSR